VIIEAASLDVTQHTAQYELLRSQVLGTQGNTSRPALSTQPRGVGLALLLREGMPGWLNAIGAVIRASLAQQTIDANQTQVPANPAACPLIPAWLSGVQRHNITTFIASLVLSTRVERSSLMEGSRSCQ
jgi:hypothetical protein